MKFEMKNRLKPCAALSAVIIVIALVMTMMGMGMNLGIDFTGGTLMTYNMGQAFSSDDVAAALNECGVADAQIAATGEGNTQVQIRIKDVENTDDLRDQLEEKLSTSIRRSSTWTSPAWARLWAASSSATRSSP